MKKSLVIQQAWCKGCGICVAFCPKNVLAVEASKVKAVKPEDCIACGLCEQRCPDYAIYLQEDKEVNE